MSAAGGAANSSAPGSGKTVSKFSPEERTGFLNLLTQFANGEKPLETVLNTLGPQRRGETAALAREELKRILERREEIEDILGLESGTLWTLEEEKLFEYGLFLHDGSTGDRFGQISTLMCGARSKEECKKRYMKLILDMCQIEMGSKNLTMVYYAPYSQPPMGQPPMPPPQGQWMS